MSLRPSIQLQYPDIINNTFSFHSSPSPSFSSILFLRPFLFTTIHHPTIQAKKSKAKQSNPTNHPLIPTAHLVKGIPIQIRSNPLPLTHSLSHENATPPRDRSAEIPTLFQLCYFLALLSLLFFSLFFSGKVLGSVVYHHGVDTDGLRVVYLGAS